jgi:two-component system, sensor histidine kinase and response regulator
MSGPDPVVDLEALLESVGGDCDLLDELAATFMQEVPGWIASLRAALERGDAAGVFRVAHGVTGAVGYFRAAPVRRLAAALEAMGREGELEAAPAALDQLETGLLELTQLLGEAPWRR